MKAKYNPVTHGGEVDADLEEVRSFVDKIIPEAIKNAGGILNDQVRFWRWKNQVKIFKKASSYLGQGAQLHKVDLKVLIPLIENGSLEDDESIIDMWARLLANASTSNDVRASYVSILKELEPTEAKIMQYIYNELVKKHGDNFAPMNEYAGSISGTAIKKLFKLSDHDFEQSIDNLYRLRLLAPTASRLDFLDNKEIPFAHYSKTTLGVTYLGYYFAKACNEDSRPAS